MMVDVSEKQTCLFLDVDGSILDIAARPQDVVVPDGLVSDLVAVEAALDGALALVSGRAIAQLDRLFAPARFRAGGVHGAEWRGRPDGEVEGAAAGTIPRAVWTEIEATVHAFPGTLVEDKRFSFAVHYRAIPEAADALRTTIRTVIERHPSAGLRLLPGHFVFEIKGADFNKGAAVRRFLANKPFAGRTPIFIGDDVTDYPGFDAAAEAGGQGFAVGTDIPGTAGTFGSPSAVRQWLAELAAREHINA